MEATRSAGDRRGAPDSVLRLSCLPPSSDAPGRIKGPGLPVVEFAPDDSWELHPKVRKVGAWGLHPSCADVMVFSFGRV